MKKLLYPVALALMSVSAIAQPNLVAHWEFTAGRTQESSHGWAATNIGTPTAVPGRSGASNTAMSFTSNTYIRVPSDPAMNLHSWTISAVVKVVQEGSNCTPNYIIRRGNPGNPGGPTHYGLYHTQEPTGAPSGCFGTNILSNRYVFAASAAGGQPFADSKWYNGSVAMQPTINLTTPEWKCITAMYDHTTETISLYVDNTLHVQEHWNNQYSGTSNDDIYIGCLTGRVDIDYIRLYDGVFPNPVSIANCGGCAATPVAHWTFDGTVNDVINGWVPSHTPPTVSYVPGARGNANTALNFAGGANDYISVPSNPAMNLTSWTIAATVRPTAFWPTDCHDNVILGRSANYTSDHYSMVIAANPNIQATGGTVCPTTVPPPPPPTIYNFAGAAAGTGTGGATAAGWWNGVNPTLVTNEWYCAILSYDAMAEELLLYVNGDFAATYYMQNQYNYIGNPDLMIGAALQSFPVVGTFHRFTGDIDDIQLFDGVLCPTDLNQRGVCQNCLTPDPVPIMEWDFEASGTTEVRNGWVPDAGSISGYVVNKAGSGWAAEFSSGDYLEFRSRPIMNLESWTISAVVKAKSFYNGQCQDNAIISRGSDYDPDHYQLLFSDNAYEQSLGASTITACNTYTPNKEVFSAKAAGIGPSHAAYMGTSPAVNPFIVDDAANTNPNAWYCVTATYDGTAGMMRIYVNGVNVVTEPYPNQYLYPFVGKPLYIGTHDPTGLFPYFFDGYIDEIKIYDHVICEEYMLKCVVQSGVLTKSTQISDVNKNHKVKIEPNPANDKVNIIVPADWASGDYVVTNSIGAIVGKGVIAGNTEINVSSFPAGMYVISTKHEGVTNTYKIVISH